MVRQMSRRSRQLKKKWRVGIRACDFIAAKSWLSCPSQIVSIVYCMCLYNIQKFHSDSTIPSQFLEALAQFAYMEMTLAEVLWLDLLNHLCVKGPMYCIVYLFIV